MAIRWQALKEHRDEAPWLVLDLAVLAMITVNLLFLLCDRLLLDTGTGVLAARFLPELVHEWRKDWHEDVLVGDTLFTGFLIGELLFRWFWAVMRKTYHRWFFYPFAHWYDVIGCFPGLQAFRLLRLASIFYRLNRIGVLVLGSSIIATAQKYYHVVLEEISDRIVINVLDGVQQEIRNGNPVSGRVRDRVLNPHRETIVRWLAEGLGSIADHAYTRHETELDSYLRQSAAAALHDNPEWSALRRRLSFVGVRLETEMQAVLGSLLSDMAGRILRDLGEPGNPAMTTVAASAYEQLTRPDPVLNRAVEQIVLEAIDLIKEQVAVQQWKLAENQSENS